MIIALIRMLKGPTAADRVVALDVMTIISISLIVFIAALLKRIIYIDVALVYALMSFIGVIAIARYLERGL
ncbi:MAG: cation:proton antiporter [Candidatus Cloacimonetes bacterium]|nr:cation:proton antiporter [Candidatus Cloacimonadota bacterium]MCF7813511.1 cation:proton antiporter [Candidatus Cloacimonadota bacterium]MCF7868705.1 cation:proton antiporter [Candidatus Cloacimonadota bacterium]MCF7884671.1 cation:proton antiporter [Candidatus Cloacimonadota bacterium]